MLIKLKGGPGPDSIRVYDDEDREIDGVTSVTINPVVPGQPVTARMEIIAELDLTADAETETDRARALLEIIGTLSLCETEGERIEACVEALRRTRVMPDELYGTFENLDQLAEWLHRTFKTTSVWDTSLVSDTEQEHHE